MSTEAETTTPPIIATIVPDELRLGTMPSFFGHSCVRVEFGVYEWMERLFPEYNGGYWEYVTLSNGGFFMYPQGEEGAVFEFDGTYTTAHGSIPLEGAGIVACLFLFSHLCSSARTDKAQEFYGNFYHLLRDYTENHTCETQILRAID